MASHLRLGAIAILARPALAAAPGGAAAQGPSEADIENIRIAYYLLYVWISILAVVLAKRLFTYTERHLRTLACLNNEKQQFFQHGNSRYASLRRYLLEAPLLRKRHNKEIMLSSAVNVGTIPTRIQTLVIVAYYGVNIAFATVYLDYGANKSTFLRELRNRTGVLSVMNMLPLFIFAGRNNLLIKLLDISFDTYNLLHRWLGRLVVLAAVAHTVAFTVSSVGAKGWKVYFISLAKSPLLLTGIIGFFAFVFLMSHSPSMIRHAYYEVFLHAHVIIALVAVIVVWMHLDLVPPYWNMSKIFLLSAVLAWGLERFTRVQNIIRNNVGAGGTLAEVQAMPGDALRITLRVARPWKFQPGQHIFLYMPTIGWWTNHPFSLAWSDEHQDVYNEKGLPMEHDVLAVRKSTVSLIVRRRTGFTDKLWVRAEAAPQGRFVTKAFVEGPYGSQNLDSYGTVMLFAAGVGITHQVPFLRSLVAGYANGTCATRRITLVWIIQSPEHLEWIRPWMTDILNMERRREVLKILLFITRPRSTKEIHSPSASVQMFPGKPDIDALVAHQQQSQVGAMAVSVCGTGSLSDDVRKSVRHRCQQTTIDFVENAFSW